MCGASASPRFGTLFGRWCGVELCCQWEVDVNIAEVLPAIAEIIPYVELAKSYDYDIEVIDIKITKEESLARNTHEVEPESIEKMADTWEDWDDKYLLDH